MKMYKFYEEISQLLPEDEHLSIDFDPVMEVIYITSSELIIYGVTAARIYSYCAANSLRCYISFCFATNSIRLGILKDC